MRSKLKKLVEIRNENIMPKRKQDIGKANASKRIVFDDICNKLNAAWSNFKKAVEKITTDAVDNGLIIYEYDSASDDIVKLDPARYPDDVFYRYVFHRCDIAGKLMPDMSNFSLHMQDCESFKKNESARLKNKLRRLKTRSSEIEHELKTVKSMSC